MIDTIVSTSILQGLVSEVSKGVGNNKLLPITSLIGIERKGFRLLRPIKPHLKETRTRSLSAIRRRTDVQHRIRS